jgi:CBS domain-containing protein
MGAQRRLFHRDRPYEQQGPSPTDTNYGPYGRDDRAAGSASGQGPGPLLGEQDRDHSLDMRHPPRDYRPWDRTGAGADTPPLGRGPYTDPGGRETFHADGADQRRHEESVHYGRNPQPVYRGQEPRYQGPTSEPAYEERRRERPWEEDRPGQDARARPDRREAAGEGYSGLVGLRQDTASRESRAPSEKGRRGRWKREPLNARELMTRNVKSARLETSLRDVARIMKDEDCGIVPVVDERGRLKGLLTDRDLVIRTLAEGRPPDTLLARDVMTDDVEAVTPDEDIHSIISLMGRRQVRRVPVVERDDRLVGIISMADIATRADYDEELQEALDRISARRSFWSRLY